MNKNASMTRMYIEMSMPINVKMFRENCECLFLQVLAIEFQSLCVRFIEADVLLYLTNIVSYLAHLCIISDAQRIIISIIDLVRSY